MGMEADGWEVEVVVDAVVDTKEKEQIGIRKKSNWAAGRKTILKADDESDLKQMLKGLGLR